MVAAPRLARLIMRRPWFWALATVPLLIGLACWWLTAPLESPGATATARSVTAHVARRPVPAAARVDWPTGRLEGTEAKRTLMAAVLAARDLLRSTDSYTATFRKRERIKGKLGAEQVLDLKVRHSPFSVYLKFRKPEAGKEVVYCDGRFDNHMIAHGTGLSRRLVPRLKVAPTSRLAMLGNRHPITEAGLLNLTEKFVGFRRLDLNDPEAVTILDRWTDDRDRTWLRSVHTHPRKNPDRPFAYIEVLYHPETLIPHRITSFDWPTSASPTERRLAEQYTYDDLVLDAPLGDLDFDPANPEYAFKRY
jgi:hypothetical protein